MKMILGQKIGMTRIFDKDNKSVSVSVIQVGPCPVICIKTKEKNNYDAIQIGYGKAKHTSMPLAGHLKKANVESVKISKEFRLDKNEIDTYKVGDSITAESFKIGDLVEVTGTSKGKGFAGGMKRHGFSGMPASHGHEKQRIPGSIGCRFPQHTIKGKRMAGHMGSETITVKNLKIVDIDAENNLLVLKGAVPGPVKSIIQIKQKNHDQN